MTSGDRLRVGIVGLGVGAAHADGFNRLPDDYEVVVVADPDASRVEFVQSFTAAEGASSLGDVLARDDVDVVSLATPPFLHLDQVSAILRAGKHAICEKPLVGSLVHVDALIDFEAETGRWVMPIFQYRYGRGLQKLLHLIDAGVTGRCHTVSVDVSWRRRPEYYDVAWRGKQATELGGILLSHCVHALDMVTLAVGQPTRAFARTTTRVNAIETEDCASVSLELADGGFATMSATLGSPAEISRHRFSFEHLSAESNTEPYENHREPWTYVADSEDDQAAIDEALATFEPGPELYKGQFARLADALRRGHRPPVTLADARSSLELLTALYWSADRGVDVALPIERTHDFYGGWQP
ncbi:MAG: Gfo/Idh/MocA family protein [Acidimicrobiales bacterium]